MGNYQISKISVDIITYKEFGLDPQFCQSTTSGSAYVPQSFSIKFLPRTTSASHVHRSGNPGYLQSKPVLVAQNADGPKQLNHDGFRFFAADDSGECLQSVGFPTLQGTEFRFGENLQIGCKVKIADANALQTYCSEAEISKQVIFNQLDKIKSLGVFGSSRTTHSGDWIAVAKQ